jgi:hypothetical protein
MRNSFLTQRCVSILVSCCVAVCAIPGAHGLGTSGQKKPGSPTGISGLPDVTFEDQHGGTGLIDGRIPFSFHDYQSSDGVALSTFIEKRRSSAGAKRALRIETRKAARIIARSPRVNSSGRRVGDRAVLIRSNQGRYKGEAAIIWTDGPTLHRIESPSLRHALLFEKLYFR